MKLYKKRITEYFSLPYDFTSEHKNGATGLVRPLSGIVVVQLLYTIIYKNIRFINLHKISLAFFVQYFYSRAIDICRYMRIIKAYQAKQ